MKHRNTYKCTNSYWGVGDDDSNFEPGHPYRPTTHDKSWALIGSPNLLDYRDWLKIGSEQRTTLGQIVFKLEMDNAHEE